MRVHGITRWLAMGSLVGGGTLALVGTGMGTASGAAPTPGTISTIAGIPSSPGNSGDNGPATAAQLKNPDDAVRDASGSIYVTDAGNCQVRKIDTSGIITTVAGTGTCATPATGVGGPATSAKLGFIPVLAIDASGNLYLTDSSNHTVWKVAPSGILTAFAGNGTSGNTGDHGPATAAELNAPYGAAVDRSGDVFIADINANVIREVNPSGIITTVAGTGAPGFSGDNGPATSANLHGPSGIWIDPSGNLFFSDTGNNRVREINTAGIITTVAGNGTYAESGDNGSATSASLKAPYGLVGDISGNLYISDYNGPTIREVNHSTGDISTLVGTAGTTGTSGDGGPSTAALLKGPGFISVDQSGNLLIADYSGHDVREVALQAPTGQGYWLGASDGGIFSHGDALFHGSQGATHLNKPIVGMAATPDGLGYWLVATDGGIFTEGSAGFFGSLGNIVLNKPIVGMAATPDGKGYWLVASDGGIFTKGDAGFFGSLGNIVLNKPIIGMAATPDGGGYWLVATDGGVFTKGDAVYYGSQGGTPLNKPIVGMAATPDGKGYWLVASDGGIFTNGDAAFYGSLGNIVLNKPIVGMASTPDGGGYWMVATDGGIFTKGDAGFFGSQGATPLNKPIVGMAPGL